MKYTVTKLDRRHSYHDEFAWMIEFRRMPTWNKTTAGGVLAFDRSRRWFNEKFGWSQDVKTRETIGRITQSDVEQIPGDYNQTWAYSVEYTEYRIYVKNEAVLNWFVLSHPKDDNEQPQY